MVDFATLLIRTDAEREVEQASSEAAYEDRLQEDDLVERQQLARQFLALKLVEVPRRIINTIGEVYYRLYGVGNRGGTVVASYKVPAWLDRESDEALFAGYHEDSVIELSGSWETVSWYTGPERHSRREFFIAYIGDEARASITNGQASRC